MSHRYRIFVTVRSNQNNLPVRRTHTDFPCDDDDAGGTHRQTILNLGALSLSRRRWSSLVPARRAIVSHHAKSHVARGLSPFGREFFSTFYNDCSTFPVLSVTQLCGFNDLFLSCFHVSSALSLPSLAFDFRTFFCFPNSQFNCSFSFLVIIITENFHYFH